ncbi:hypothetical protein ILUMI_03139 [Ignelater luminosus]|uniref:Cell cycle checkpoint protein RAD17 n=1 Tax=Ignelater luminosus TaxID=2038154 RepID=A0A8K0GIL7_IGNLU|nr:hypothetical protein ILUMI_03139 [Ignelater luminosus]
MKKAARKWIAFNFDATPDSNLKTSTKAVNVVHTGSVNTTPIRNANQNNSTSTSNKNKMNFNFMEKLKPKTIEDLAVHPKKIKEVETWIQQNVLYANQVGVPILLLTGPTGCGKTATINVLCSIMNIKVVEWINPTDQDSEMSFMQAQIGKFLDFFTQSKYTSLCESSQKKIALVEDFPNFVVYNPTEFSGILEKCSNGSSPIVFICTDASNKKLDLSQTLFSQEIRDKYHITNISFNPCSNTLLKGALKRAYNLAQNHSDLFSNVSSDIIDAIICTSMGDIRCSLNQYQFSTLKGMCEISTTVNLNRSRGTKRKRNEKTSTSINVMSKDEMLGFFHGLGRVLNPKRIEINNSWRIQCDFNALIDQLGTQPSVFSAFLQENYLKYFGDLNDVQKAADVLSQAQVFLEKWTERNDILVYALWISVLGLMVFNEHKVSRWNQIKAPTKVKRISDSNLETRSLNKEDYLYYNIITNSNKFYTFKS